MRTERFLTLALTHSCKDIPIDAEVVASAFCSKKKRMLNFGFP